MDAHTTTREGHGSSSRTTTCASCHGLGHLADRWTGRCWLTIRGCDVCGMREPTREGAEQLLEHLATTARRAS